MRVTTKEERPIFNVFYQNPLFNDNIVVAFNPIMAKEIVSLILETCMAEDGTEDRTEYAHLYGLADKFTSHMKYSAHQSLCRNDRSSAMNQN